MIDFTMKKALPQGKKTSLCFFLPDFTVASRISLDQPIGSWGLPPVRIFTLP